MTNNYNVNGHQLKSTVSKYTVVATPIHLVARSEDKLAWKLYLKGKFDMKSTYLLMLDPYIEAPFKAKWIWTLKTLPRIQTFVWKCMHKSIGVRECLSERRLTLDNACPIC